MEEQTSGFADLVAELVQLVGPAQGLHVLQVGVGGQALGEEAQSIGCIVHMSVVNRYIINRSFIDTHSSKSILSTGIRS